jgi:LuxR family maltose regulon positive regulatory protein
VLESKLRVPATRPDLVPRPRLDAALDAGRSRVTLVSAQAGFGKTTALARWASARATAGHPVAWLSLDPGDDDPAVLWPQLVAALDRAVPGAVGGTRAALEQGADVVAALLHDLDLLDDDLVVVLDDVHVLTSPEVLDGLALLVERLPPRVRLVLATRADPAVPLARLRSRGELGEVRADDLRFTGEEVTAYLGAQVGAVLDPQQVATLAERTEGWPAALQLAALSLRGRADVAGFVADFSGNDRHVVDFLVEEVLRRQPDEVRAFLLRTSVLGRLTGPLCDAVTGGRDGGAVLERLERDNVLLVPLDDQRRWYRYHHLFADVLRARLDREHPQDVAELHRRAARWWERHDGPTEAVEHALAAGDGDLAGALVEAAVPALRAGRQEATLRRWLEALPEAVIAGRPALGVAYAGMLLVHGEVAGVERRLDAAERWLDAAATASDAAAGVRDAAAGLRDAAATAPDAGGAPLSAVRVQVALFRAAQARARGDGAATVRHARRALDSAAEDDHLAHGAAAGLLGLAHWADGDLEAGHRWWSASADSLERAGHLADLAGCALALGEISSTQGDLDGALATYHRFLDRVAPPGGPVLRGAADLHVGIATVLRERGDLDGARRHLAAAAELGDEAGLPQHPHRRRVAAALLHESEGDLASAVALLDEAQRVYAPDLFPDVRPIAALRARVLLRQGRLTEARAWIRSRGLSAADEPAPLRELEHLVLARVLLAEHAVAGDARALEDALVLLERLGAAAHAQGRAGSAVEIGVVRALALRAAGDEPGAVGALGHAVDLATPGGWVRVFLDEGAPVTSLLRELDRQGRVPTSARLLLRAARTGGAGSALVDPLSARELEVLRLLGGDQTGPEIARALVLSLNTVRTHTKSIYAKLGVGSRRAAVRRATGLGLLEGGGPQITPQDHHMW